MEAVEPGWPGVDAGRWVSHCKQACLRGTAPGARGAEMQQVRPLSRVHTLEVRGEEACDDTRF